MAKPYGEKIGSIEEQIQQLENRRRQLVQQQKEHDRKARTKRLIERGAILESLIGGAEALSNEEIKALLQTALASAPASEKPGNAGKLPDTGESLA